MSQDIVDDGVNVGNVDGVVAVDIAFDRSFSTSIAENDFNDDIDVGNIDYTVTVDVIGVFWLIYQLVEGNVIDIDTAAGNLHDAETHRLFDTNVVTEPNEIHVLPLSVL